MARCCGPEQNRLIKGHRDGDATSMTAEAARPSLRCAILVACASDLWPICERIFRRSLPSKDVLTRYKWCGLRYKTHIPSGMETRRPGRKGDMQGKTR